MIAWLFIGIGLSLTLIGVLTGALLAPSHPGLGLGEAMGARAAMIVVVIVGAIIALVGLLGYFVPGVEKLAETNPEFSTAATLIRVGLFYGQILLLIGALLIVFDFGIPIVFTVVILIVIIGFILNIIGSIGLVILSFKLNDVEKNALYLAAGILYIIAIFVSLAAFVAWILLYIALGDSVKKARQAPPPVQPQPTGPLPPPV
ncbi:Protein of unknown function (DUF996) [Desulfurococcus amylolyticus 1221n]|uniref:DUF973 family protein n=2 Tax=Desulfurococcus amylolyticus TaxID=94694 RepID=B8D602_DESA1|nr:Protein of unknown function (DUF996) [Desulfurococcus amylolyticus 1221n]